MSSARPHFSRMDPIRVKKGIASNNSLDKIPNTLSGRLAMKAAGNQPISMAMKPHSRPKAESENATGNPISMMRISPPNISGAKLSMLIPPSGESSLRKRPCRRGRAIQRGKSLQRSFVMEVHVIDMHEPAGALDDFGQALQQHQRETQRQHQHGRPADQPASVARHFLRHVHAQE